MMRAVLLLIAASAAVFAQSSGQLSGRVVDPSGSAVPGARVSISRRDIPALQTASTDVGGQFQFSALSAGEYTIEASSGGFGTSAPQTVRVESDKPAEVELRLDIARVATQVQVTAAAIAQTVDEQSKALDVIDAAELDRRAEYTLTEALRTVPGVKVLQYGGPGSFSRIIIRGTRPTDSSVLIDGIRLRDAASPQGDISAFTADLLVTNADRIEVLRGSGSSLYGTHATGGVVNIITDQGGGDLRGDIALEGGGMGLFRGTARGSGSALPNRVRFSGGATQLSVLDGVDGDDKVRNTTGHGFVQWQAASETAVSGRLLVSDSFTSLNDNPAPLAGLPAREIVRAVPNVTYTPALNDPDQKRWGRTLSALTGIDHAWSPRVRTKISYALVSTSRDNRDGVLGQSFEPAFPDQNVFEGRIDTAQARVDVNPDRNHLLTAGYEFERESFDNISRDFNPDPVARTDARIRIKQTSHAAFAQAQGRYLDSRLQLLASGRIQKFGLERPRLSGNSPLYQDVPLPDPPDARTGDLSAAYTIARTGTKIRGHLGSGYRAPSLYERFGASFFFGSFSAYGDPRLGPERVLAFDGGFDQYFASSRVRVSGTYFYTRIQEAIIFDFTGIIVPESDPYSRFGGYRNTGGGIARGAEVSVEANPVRSLTLQSSYTYTKALDRRSQYGNSILRAVRVSDHMFTATASQRIGRAFDLTFDLFAASNYLAPFGNRAFEWDGPVKADVVGSYTRKAGERHMIRFYTRVENVLNRRYYEEGFRTPRAWATGGVKWMF